MRQLLRKQSPSPNDIRSRRVTPPGNWVKGVTIAQNSVPKVSQEDARETETHASGEDMLGELLACHLVT